MNSEFDIGGFLGTLTVVLGVPAFRAFWRWLRSRPWPLEEFLSECCRVEPSAQVEAGALRHAYEAWCHRNFKQRISNANWTQRLEAMGCTRTRTRKGDTHVEVWHGIGLLDEPANHEAAP